MAEWSGFFDAHKSGNSWDRTYLAEDFAKFFAPLIGNGVFAGKSNELQVFQTSPASMSVVVSSGQSWIEGYGYLNDSDLLIPISPADGALSRIDRIVNQWSAEDRQIRTVCKKGTPAVNPVAPILRWDADYKELNLCTLNISAGIPSITQDKIKDTRADNSVCGWVTGLIKQVDTATLFAQWEAAYEKEFTEQKSAWENFFKDVQLDLGVPVPSPDKANFVLSVNPVGGYFLSNDYASKEYSNTRYPRNLLDNSNLTNPVCQRGIEYSYHNDDLDEGIYTMDRWKAGPKVDVTYDPDFRRTDVQAYGERKEFYQIIEAEKIVGGQTYTLATNSTYEGVLSGVVVAPTKTGDSNHIVSDFIELHLSRNEDGTYRFVITIKEKMTVGFYWAALYRNEYTTETLPDYRPKDYSAELAECQRYYYEVAGYHAWVGYKSTTAYAFITLPVKMRTKPSVVAEEITTRGAIEGASNTVSIASIFYDTFGNDIRLSLSETVLTNHQTLILITRGLVISADL